MDEPVAFDKRELNARRWNEWFLRIRCSVGEVGGQGRQRLLGVTTSKNTNTETPKHQPKASKQGLEMNESVVDGYADLISEGVRFVSASKGF